jgi:hypothetical protein
MKTFFCASASAVLLLLSLNTGVSACAVPPPGLVAWWPGGSTGASVVGLPATPNGVTAGPGKVGEAFLLDGNGQYLSTELDVQPSALPQTTWEAWVYPTRVNISGRQQILSHDVGGYGRSVLLETGTSNFGVFTGNGVWQPAPVTLNAWQHIAVVFTETNLYFYKDGVEYVSGIDPVERTSSAKLQIGRNPVYGEYFQGMIDEVSVYDRALSAGEIQGLYAAGSFGKCRSAGTADLSLTLQTTPALTQLGGFFTNTIVVANQGPDLSAQTAVAFTRPPGMTLVDAQSSQGSWSHGGAESMCLVGDLSAGADVNLLLVLKADTAGQKVASVTVAGLAADPDLADNQAAQVVQVYERYSAEDGDWSADYLILTNTPEATLMVRTGDIDNLGFGWPAGFNPFSGNTTPGHSYPWTPPTNTPPGTDRIMVVSSYVGQPPRGQDGYTGTTSRPGNQVEPIVLAYQLGGLPVVSAALQMFVDDFQAPVWGAVYKVTLNGVRAPFLETTINALSQSGPVGKLISANIPPDFLALLESNQLSILIDDDTTGAGDGFAIDFVKLLINVRAFGQVGTIQGRVLDAATQQPIPGVQLWAGGNAVTTGGDGRYTLSSIPAGLVLVQASHYDYAPQIKTTDLVHGQTNTLDFSLVLQPRLTLQHSLNDVLLSWPASLTGYVLQTSPSLIPAQWVLEGSVPDVIDGRNTVVNPIAGSTRFYRLFKP